MIGLETTFALQTGKLTGTSSRDDKPRSLRDSRFIGAALLKNETARFFSNPTSNSFDSDEVRSVVVLIGEEKFERAFSFDIAGIGIFHRGAREFRQPFGFIVRCLIPTLAVEYAS